jgi:hypothetical protein
MIHCAQCTTVSHTRHAAPICPLQVLPGASYHAVYDLVLDEDEKLLPRMLLVNAMRHNEPGRARLVEMLLQRGPPPLEETYQDSGETALSTAVRFDDVELGMQGCWDVRRELVMVGFLCNAGCCRHSRKAHAVGAVGHPQHTQTQQLCLAQLGNYSVLTGCRSGDGSVEDVFNNRSMLTCWWLLR